MNITKIELENKEYNQSEIIKWIGDSEIITYNEGRDNLIIITDEGMGYFSMYRFFLGGGKTHCSVDLQEKELKDLLTKLLAIRNQTND